MARPDAPPPSPLDWAHDGHDWPHRAHSVFVDAAGLRWHLQRWGDAAAPAVLLLHGTGASAHSWRTLAPLVATRWQVLAPDLPGHAFTSVPAAASDALTLPGMAAAVAALLRTLAVAPQAVIGHSAGAAVGARLVLDAPATAAPRLLVAINGAFRPYGGALAPLFSPLARLLWAWPAVARALARRAVDPAVVRRLVAGTGSALDDEGLGWYRRLTCSPAHTRAALGMMARWELRPLLHELVRLPVPLQLLVGEADRAVSPAAARRITRRVPAARCTSLPGLGHLAHEEDAAAVWRVLEPLLDAAGGALSGPAAAPARRPRGRDAADAAPGSRG